MRVMHVIPGLGVGGAERFLGRLADQLGTTHGVRQCVVSLDPRHVSGVDDFADGIEVRYLDCGQIWKLPIAVYKLRKLAVEFAPHIIQGWLYRGDLLATLCRTAAPRAVLFWNIRCSDAILRLSTRMLRRLCATLSYHQPDKIITCGKRALEAHKRAGYDPTRMVVINNGYDFPVLNASQQDNHLRHEGTLLIGAVGRFDPSKDFGTLLRALSLLLKSGHNVRLEIAGRDCTYENKILASWIDNLGLRQCVGLRGELLNIESFYKAMDIFCQSSVSEGFPNAVCEAMSFGVVPVVTDAGEAAEIVGSDGFVVPISDDVQLADALAKVAALSPTKRLELGQRAARGVRERYQMSSIAEEYIEIYSNILGR